MGSSPTDLPELRFPPQEDVYPRYTVAPASPVRAGRREPLRRYVILFVLTCITTTLVGADHYAGFRSGLGTRPMDLTFVELLIRGLWYSGGVLAILGAHEFGHYFACRYYGIDSSLPYFLPFWLPLGPTPGTLGAVIRIRQPIATKRQFFDIGIAGPIAGFVVLVPVLLLGMSLSDVVLLPADFRGLEFGEPLLFKFASWLVFGTVQDGYTVNVHPAGWAAWFGLLATALNLTPIGQLDGGHISYAVFGRKSSAITLTVVVILLGLLFVSTGYLLWTVLMVAMLVYIGVHHPRAIDESEPLNQTRLWLAVVAALIFAISFTPVPISLIDL